MSHRLQLCNKKSVGEQSGNVLLILTNIVVVRKLINVLIHSNEIIYYY